MPSATAGGANLTAYFKLDGSRNITGPTNIYNSVGTLASDVLTIRGAAGQTGDLLALQTSAPADLVRWLFDGRQAATMTLTASGLEDRYAVSRTITLNSTTGQIAGGGFMSVNIPVGQDVFVYSGYVFTTTVVGKADFGHGFTASYISSSGVAQSEGNSANIVAQHAGAGLLGILRGAKVATAATGPVTTHASLDVTTTATSTSTNAIAGRFIVNSIGTTSAGLYGVKIELNKIAGTVPLVAGLDITVTGTGSTKTRAIRASGDVEIVGDIYLTDTGKIVGGTATTADLTLQTTTGIGATGADMHFLVGNAGALEALTILNNGNVGIRASGSFGARLTIGGSSIYDGGLFVSAGVSTTSRVANFGDVFEIVSGGAPSWVGQGIRVDGANRKFQFVLSPSISTDSEAFEIDTSSNSTLFAGPTSGDKTFIRYGLLADFKPTSGTATLAWSKIMGTVNQTGGANGITRGLWIATTITAAADWRALEITPNTGYGIYQSGASADNYFNGDVGIKTLVPNNALDVTGTVQADGLRLDVTPTAETIVPTHTITISVNGTNYKIPIVLA